MGAWNVQFPVCIFLDFSSLLFRNRTGTDIPPNPQSPRSIAAKSQHITESGDYIAIHSYYPRGRKHEPFRAAATAAAAAIHHRRPSLPLLSGPFFPEALTTNDSGATPECGNERCTPGARGGNVIQMNGLAALLPRIWKPPRPPQAVGTQRPPFVAERQHSHTWGRLLDGPVGVHASIRSVNKVKMYANANAENISFLAARIDTGVNSHSPLPPLLLLYYDSWPIGRKSHRLDAESN